MSPQVFVVVAILPPPSNIFLEISPKIMHYIRSKGCPHVILSSSMRSEGNIMHFHISYTVLSITLIIFCIHYVSICLPRCSTMCILFQKSSYHPIFWKMVRKPRNLFWPKCVVWWCSKSHVHWRIKDCLHNKDTHHFQKSYNNLLSK